MPTTSTARARRRVFARPTGTVLDVDVVAAPDELSAREIERLAAIALASAGIEDGHVAVEFVDSERIRELNRDHRGRDAPTDVLSFPIDSDGEPARPRELRDVVIAPHPPSGKR